MPKFLFRNVTHHCLGDYLRAVFADLHTVNAVQAIMAQVKG